MSQIPSIGARWKLLVIAICLICSYPVVALAADNPSIAEPLPAITNVAQFQQWVAQSQQTNWPVRLKGVVCWSDMARGMMILQDDSGTGLIEMSSESRPIQPGEIVSVKGTYGGSQGGVSLRIGNLTLNDDCRQGMREVSEPYTLKAGKYPVSLSWFDGNHLDGLYVFYEATNLPRRSIPDSELVHPVSNRSDGTTNWVRGLHYSAYVGNWNQLPDYGKLIPVKKGIVPNFDIGVETRDRGVGLRFSGYLQIQQDGIYRFTLMPRGRRQLFVDQARLDVLGATAAPQARRIFPGQILSEQEPSIWAQVEGIVTFLSKEQSKGLHMELSTDTGNLWMRIADGSGGCSGLLSGSRIRVTGICRSAYTVDGQRIFGDMWTPDLSQVELREVAARFWISHPVLTAGSLLFTNFPDGMEPMVHVAGQVCATGPNRSITIQDATGKVTLQSSKPLPGIGDHVEALGKWSRQGTNVFLRNAFYREIKHTPQATELLPLLTSAEQVKQLTRAEALRGYPVQIQGVVTWSGGGGAVLQDSGMGIFVDVVDAEDSGAQHIGEYWRVEGVTTDQFSPMILARTVVHLGLGDLPNPIHPTWDQLMNGTLDTEYVEIQGMVTAVKMNSLALLTHNGTIQVDLPEMQSEELKSYQDALISIRGCLWAAKNETTHVFRPGEVEIHNASISVKQPAPADPFAAPLKRVSQLLLFDAKASALERVKVRGQIIHHSDGEYYLMDGPNGLQFVTRTNVSLDVGDEVEIVGFPLLGGPVPILREAIGRRLGHAHLPAATQLSEDSLLNENYVSTLVKVKALLVSLSYGESDQVLALRAGSHMIMARLDRQLGEIPSIPVGSKLEVKGVYIGRGGDRTAGRAIDSFELLLNSPADIQVLERPSWWTIERMLTMIGVLVGFLTVALVWIGMLRRQVELRTTQLKEEVLAREQTEQQRAVEAERSRIARDLHDDLGSSLTEISVLADAGGGWPSTPEKAVERFKSIGNKARAVVKALDVIVWLVNPSKDFLPFFLSYLGSYAEEYLSPCGIACRVKVPPNVPHCQLTAQVRHNLFLAVKEALHNVVRHARASHVTVEMAINGEDLKIAIIDDGQGFNNTGPSSGNGLSNFNNRLSNIGGQCQIASGAEVGTVVTFTLPLAANQNS